MPCAKDLGLIVFTADLCPVVYLLYTIRHMFDITLYAGSMGLHVQVVIYLSAFKTTPWCMI